MRLLDHVSVTNPWARLISTSILGGLCYVVGMILFAHQALDHLEEIFESTDLPLARRVLFVIQRMRVKGFFNSRLIRP
jgi:hypothetical protein